MSKRIPLTQGTAEKRFWDKVERRGPDECWEWQAARTHGGYGELKVGGKMFYAHRLAWELANGLIPDGLCICHRCDNQRCVNPSHLFVGTVADNNHDMKQKGRCGTARGAKSGNAKLTQEDVHQIRDLYESGDYLQRELGERFGVTKQYVGQIVNRKRWAWLK